MASLIFMTSTIKYRLVTLTIDSVTMFLQLWAISHIHQNKTETKKKECLKTYECFHIYTEKLNNEAKTCTNWILFFGGVRGVSAAEYSNFARLLSSITQHSFNYTCTYTTTCVVYNFVEQDNRGHYFTCYQDLAHSDYKDHDLKEVTLNISGSL